MTPRFCCWFLVVAACLAFGCSSPQSDIEGPVATAQPTIETAPASSVASAEPPVPTAVASATATAASTTAAPQPTGVAFEKRFLPHDVKCEKDSDCAMTKRGVSERLFCCDACDAVPGGKAWVARADLRCSAYDKEPAHHTCPPRDCAAPRGARCNHGACELLQ